MKHRTVAALLQRDSRVLLCQRTETRDWHPGVWDLPGGHVLDESVEDAIRRELREELNIQPMLESARSRVLETTEVAVTLWEIPEWSGQLRNNCPSEHAQIAWFTHSEAQELPLGPLASHLLGSQPT